MTSLAETSTRAGNRVPPHSADAEESVLGAILLSSDAANQVMDKLHADDFYVPAHQAIFEAITGLYNANQAIDAITVAEVLRRSGELERIGGVSYLTGLINTVPSASNVEWYASIVEEHALRRNLMRAGALVNDVALQVDWDINEVLDRAEQTVLAVAERRVGEGMLPVGPMFAETLEHIEMLEAHGSDVTGVSTGFRDLDKKLAGLQKANLVIIAARPSMGKCLAGSTRVVDPKTGELVTIEELVDNAERHGLAHTVSLDFESGKLVPSAPVAWADNGIKPTFRVTTRLGRQITATANHPLLTFAGWQRIDQLTPGDAIAVPRHLDVEGVDELADAEIALIGYLIGDGDITGNPPRITNTNPVVVGDVERWAGQLGLRLSRDGDRPTYRLVKQDSPTQAKVAARAGVSPATVSLALGPNAGRLARATRRRVEAAAQEVGYRGFLRNPLTQLLEAHGLAGCDAHHKFVPGALFRTSRRQLALFLSRLFATDGSAWISGNIYRVEYVTVSKRLAADLHHLLLRFGVLAKIRRRTVSYNGSRRVAYEVAFQDPLSLRRFASKIGIFGKERQLAEVVSLANRRSQPRAAAEQVPLEVWDLVLRAKGNRSWREVSLLTGRPASHNWHVGRRRLSRRLITELAVALDDEQLRYVAEEEVVWDPIVSIEAAGTQRTYDLSIPGYRNFVADDVIVHNSALSTNIATNVAQAGNTVAVFSLEMSKDEVVQRILCSVGRVDSMKLRTGQLGPLWPKVVDAASRMYRAPIFVDDSAVVTVTDIRAKCRRLKRQHGLSLVVVDYIQLMQGMTRENRQQEISEISRGLKNLARELDVPIIAVSQLNRSLETREDKRPRLADLRESGALEQDSDVVMFIYRHEYYHPDDQEKKGMAEVHIAKHRAGATGLVEMTFLPEFTRFADLGRDLA